MYEILKDNNGEVHDRIRYGDEKGPWGSKQSCPDCGHKQGELHLLGCDIERCPICGLQLVTCGHMENIVE